MQNLPMNSQLQPSTVHLPQHSTKLCLSIKLEYDCFMFRCCVGTILTGSDKYASSPKRPNHHHHLTGARLSSMPSSSLAPLQRAVAFVAVLIVVCVKLCNSAYFDGSYSVVVPTDSLALTNTNEVRACALSIRCKKQQMQSGAKRHVGEARGRRAGTPFVVELKIGSTFQSFAFSVTSPLLVSRSLQLKTFLAVTSPHFSTPQTHSHTCRSFRLHTYTDHLRSNDEVEGPTYCKRAANDVCIQYFRSFVTVYSTLLSLSPFSLLPLSLIL